MSKKNNTSRSTGNTVNPAPQPTAPATAAAASGTTTAQPLAGSRDPQAAKEADAFNAQAMNFLQNSIDIGSGDQDDTVRLADALSGTGAAEVSDPDEQPPQAPATAEDANPDEEAAAADAGGETPENHEPGDATAEPAAEAEAEAAAETAEPENEAGDDEDGGKWPKSYLRRINKLTAKIDRLEEKANEADALREENERLKSAAPAEREDAPVVAVTDVEQNLTGKISALEERLEFIEAHPNGAEVNGQEFSAEALRKAKRDFERQLRDAEDDLRTARRERTARGQQLEAALVRDHPFMADRKSAARASVESFLNSFPVLKSDPLFKLMVADALAHRKSLKAKAAPATTSGTGTTPRPAATAAAAPPPPRIVSRTPGKPSGRPAPVNGTHASNAAAHEKFMKTGDASAGKELVASILELAG